MPKPILLLRERPREPGDAELRAMLDQAADLVPISKYELASGPV
jgi:hypothetical protein